MAHGEGSHASLGNVENNIARKWINGLLCGAEARALRDLCDLQKAGPPKRGKSH
jgi:hypothetical protein